MSNADRFTSRLKLAVLLAPLAVLAGCAAKGKMAIPSGADAVKTDMGSVQIKLGCKTHSVVK